MVVPDDVLKQLGFSGNTAKGWSVFSLCEACAVLGLSSHIYAQYKAQSKKSNMQSKILALQLLSWRAFHSYICLSGGALGIASFCTS
jgi:hypothetical protein